MTCVEIKRYTFLELGLLSLKPSVPEGYVSRGTKIEEVLADQRT